MLNLLSRKENANYMFCVFSSPSARFSSGGFGARDYRQTPGGGGFGGGGGRGGPRTGGYGGGGSRGGFGGGKRSALF